MLKQKGFGKAWYGTLFVQCEGCGGEIEGGWGAAGGHYYIGPNTIKIYDRPKRGVAGLIIHELGHRWWFKNMSRENRLKFDEWFDAGLAPVSAYGSRNSAEAFAEAFRHYVEGLSMTPQQVETFKLVALGRRFAAKKLPINTLKREDSKAPQKGPGSWKASS